MEKIYKIVIVSLLFALFPVFVKAANLYISPSGGNYFVGQNFSVNVFVSSPNQSINAASGLIKFPKDIVEVVSLSKNNSIFSLWVKEPTFSNVDASINFEGVILNPGFIGSSGQIVSINFRTKEAGPVSLSFSSALVLANDGKGTNILQSTSGSNFVLNEAKPVDETPKIEKPIISIEKPSSPQIISPTHLDSDSWYQQKNVKLACL